jgi:hypothetical protein
MMRWRQRGRSRARRGYNNPPRALDIDEVGGRQAVLRDEDGVHAELTLHYKVHVSIVAASIGEVECVSQAPGPVNVAGPSLAVFFAFWGYYSSVLLHKLRIWI